MSSGGMNCDNIIISSYEGNLMGACYYNYSSRFQECPIKSSSLNLSHSGVQTFAQKGNSETARASQILIGINITGQKLRFLHFVWDWV